MVNNALIGYLWLQQPSLLGWQAELQFMPSLKHLHLLLVLAQVCPNAPFITLSCAYPSQPRQISDTSSDIFSYILDFERMVLHDIESIPFKKVVNNAMVCTNFEFTIFRFLS